MGNAKIEESKNEEFFKAIDDIEKGKSPSYDDNTGAAAETSVKSESARPESRTTYSGVPSYVREKNKHIFEPLLVSLGPYHHGQPQCRQFEEIKDEVVNFIFNSDKDKGNLVYSKIRERVDEIRVFYGKSSVEEYTNKKLATMMYRDACCALYGMEFATGKEDVIEHFYQTIGPMVLSSLREDNLKLENQIPWWIIKLLIKLMHDDDKIDHEDTDIDNDDDDNNNHGFKRGGRAFIFKYLTKFEFGDYKRVEKKVFWEVLIKYGEPLHILELLLTFLRANLDMQLRENHPVRSRFESLKRPFRSATDLQAKGIYFKRSSRNLNDIQFSSYPFYGVLHLPVLLISRRVLVLFSNLVALEMSPGGRPRRSIVTPYVNFMKSLIESPNDVKILQENGILYSYTADNEQIFRIFNEIHTHGLDDSHSFADINKRINEHCNSKAKTWMAELINTHFRTPWTVTGCVVAAFLLCLTFLQTYYTMNQQKKK